MTTTHQPSQNFNFAAAIGGGKWRGFATREEAEAWAQANAQGRFIQIVPACLASKVIAP